MGTKGPWHGVDQVLCKPRSGNLLHSSGVDAALASKVRFAPDLASTSATMRTAIITVLFPTMLFAQGERVGWIEQQVQEIDSDHTLVVDTIDATTIYNVDFDGGGVVYYGYRRKEF